MPLDNITISRELQKQDQGSAWISLYELDATEIGGSIWRFTNHLNHHGGIVSFGGIEYSPIPVKMEGWEMKSSGTSAKPSLTVGMADQEYDTNVNPTLMASVITLGDLVGAKLSRIRTFARYIDDGETPDPSAFVGPDVVFVEQKIQHDRSSIQWQLTSVVDRMGMKLPRRQILKDASYLGCSFPGVGRNRVS